MTSPSSAEQQLVRRWIAAAFIVFAALGLSFGTWLSRLPAVRDHLDASTLQMSIYGLCLAAGSLTGFTFSGRLVSWLGSRRTLLISMPMQFVMMTAAMLLFWADMVVPAVGALFLYGISFSTSDVAINVTGAEAERALGRPRMPLLHGSYSLGGVTAMGIGSAAESLGIPFPIHIAAVLAALAAAALLVLRWIPRSREVPATRPVSTITGPVSLPPDGGDPAPAKDPAAHNPWRDPRIYLIGTIALGMSLVEGTGSDWLALALVDGRGFSNSSATLLVGVFFVSMMLTRMTGSFALMRFGNVAVIRGSAVLCAVGVLVVILAPAPWASVLGAILWGAGCSLGFPVAISAAADDPARAARNVAAVAAIGYGAFLIGPMVIGVLGNAVGLLNAFWPLVAIAALCFAIAGALRQPATTGRAGGSTESP